MKLATLDALPRQVVWLGYGGLLPFVGLAVTILADPSHGLLWGDALVAYGAVILSFVGALHWGFAMCLAGLTEARRGACFVCSTVPALVAWPALLAAPFSRPCCSWADSSPTTGRTAASRLRSPCPRGTCRCACD